MVSHSQQLEDSWREVLQPELADCGLDQALTFANQQRRTCTVFPPADEIFHAFHGCPFAATKVVILGQDPYHGEGQAHGLAFSVRAGTKLPPSLRNMFQELADDIGCKNTSGDLTAWSRQGILLLNTVLSVESGKAHSHRNQGWESFTDLVLRKLGEQERKIVFVLWGNPAGKKSGLIGPQHTVITSPHPSPLSAYRGFFGSRPFSRINSALEQFGESPIEWSLPGSSLLDQ